MGGRRRGFESVAVVFVSNSKKWVFGEKRRGSERKSLVGFEVGKVVVLWLWIYGERE